MAAKTRTMPLTPTMSALIIIAHVKDGVDLAVKHKLNPRIIDVIQEHHGDSLVAYFYRRAQEQKKLELEKVDRRLENPEDLPMIDEKNFRYPGPRPSTRESGIIALADSVESASRSLRKPTPARIRALVEDLVRAKIHDGQLDDCPLTLQELAIVKESFANTLRSMLHSRIDYPKDDERSSTGTKQPGSGPRHHPRRSRHRHAQAGVSPPSRKHFLMSLEVIIGNHQEITEIPENWLTALEDIANEAADLALAHAAAEDSPLAHLATLEVALVDDETSDRVHRDFMNIEGPTDVITFHHGEIVIGAEVAERQAAEYGEPLAREILRYLVHGLLHLAGHEDADRGRDAPPWKPPRKPSLPNCGRPACKLASDPDVSSTMHRRSFLMTTGKTAAITAVAARWPPASPPPMPPRPHRINHSVCKWCYDEHPA